MLEGKISSSSSSKPTSRQQLFSDLLEQVKAVISGEPSYIANCSNVSSLIFHALNENSDLFDASRNGAAQAVNWAGFYLVDRAKKREKGIDELVLGPFQGKVACIRIDFARGVCGRCARTGETVVVRDVHEFPGHIACDSASNSEIVVPIFAGNENKRQLVGVLDVDSPNLGQFEDFETRECFEKICEALSRECDFHVHSE